MIVGMILERDLEGLSCDCTGSILERDLEGLSCDCRHDIGERLGGFVV